MSTKTFEVRSLARLKPVDDNEKEFPDSIVDTSGYLPLNHIVQKCIRGEARITPGQSIYEVGEDDSPEDAIDRLDPSRADGFDLADAHNILSKASEIVRQLKVKKENSSPEKGLKKEPASPEKGEQASPPAKSEKSDPPSIST